ncbi:MAG: hypothetical protein RIG82_05250, partial [Phycisphaeraceae bacterium]
MDGTRTDAVDESGGYLCGRQRGVMDAVPALAATHFYYDNQSIIETCDASGGVYQQFACADQPVIDPDGLIAPFCSSAGDFLPLLCTMNVTAVTEEVREAFNLDHEQLTEQAAA